MSDTDRLDKDVTVECRSCHEEMSADSKRCPHCGTRAITRYESAAIALGGLVVTVATALTGLWLVTALGALAFLAGLGLFWNRRQKLQQATV
jgi:hypothetical protein